MQANTDHMEVPRYPVTIVMGIAFGILAWLEWLEPQLQAGGLLVGCPNGRKFGVAWVAGNPAKGTPRSRPSPVPCDANESRA